MPAAQGLPAAVAAKLAFPERPVYDKVAAERHWERLFALFRRCLQPLVAAPAAPAA